MANPIDQSSFAWGMVIGVTFGSWLRGTLDALCRTGLPRGSNPPSPGRKPAPPPGPPSAGNCERPQVAPPAPGMRRKYLWIPSQMAECGGPCWEARDPRCCDCGALWRDVPCKSVALTEGPVQRGHGNGGPSTPKPEIIPKPQFPQPRIIRDDFIE
jgi:hypothetical protein